MELKKISDNVYEIEREGKMLVPARIYASEKLVKDIKKDKTLSQIKNVACLPGILKNAIALADSHQGYGFPIGGVAVFDLDNGIVSPGGVGYDINCSVRLLKTNLFRKDFEKNKEKVLDNLFKKIPSGVGRGSGFQINEKELNKLLEGGAKYMVEKGYGVENDYLNTEAEGCLNADSFKVSERAVKRGIGQVGTLGAGNHFLEIQIVDEVFDKDIAKVFGLEKDQVLIMIHCGSRGLGHQIASDYIKKMEKEYGFEGLQDRELINAPIKSELGKDYILAMGAASNFAFANKQLITHWIREDLQSSFPNIEVDVVYDVCHNIAKFEDHLIDGKMKKVCVHRKGATSSFGPGSKYVPEKYKKVGQPVLIPGSMGTSSYILVGTRKAEELTFASTVHGAGRVLSRIGAMKKKSGEEVKEALCCKGIDIKTGSIKGLAQESPEAYKDVDEVVKTVCDLGINKKIFRLKPLAVIKG